MSSLVFDIETDGFDYTKIWCIVTQDIHTKEVFEYPPEKIEDGLKQLAGADKVIGHNLLGFDIPAIEELHGLDFSGVSIIDTLVVSRLFNPTREGGHGLESWGYRLGRKKKDFGDPDDPNKFKTYTPEMLEYCRGDVELNTDVYWHLTKAEARGFSRQAIDLEHGVYKAVLSQMRKGFKLDVAYTEKFRDELESELEQIAQEVHQTFRPKVDELKIFPRYVKSGDLAKTGDTISHGGKQLTADEYEYLLTDPTRNFVVRTTEIPFNLASNKQVGEYLMDFGWKPTLFTDNGQPKTSESVLAKITDIPEATLINRYNKANKMLSFTVNWLSNYREDTHRVHGYVNPIGTVTHRMSHSNPNLGQIPRAGKYGAKCRRCWIVDEGKVLVGADASGLELRLLAHYLDDNLFTQEIINGDIHERNRIVTELQSRDQAKTFIYAYLYGAGDFKLGSIAGGGKRLGAQLRARLLSGYASLKTLQTRIKDAARSGYINGLDTRKIKCRSAHSALNTLLQSAGSIVMKTSLVLLYNKLEESGIEYSFVANVHDEIQTETLPEHGDMVGQMAVDSIIEAGVLLNLNCPLDGEYKIGASWAETH